MVFSEYLTCGKMRLTFFEFAYLNANQTHSLVYSILEQSERNTQKINTENTSILCLLRIIKKFVNELR